MIGQIKTAELRRLPIRTIEKLCRATARDLDAGADTRDILERMIRIVQERSDGRKTS